MSYFIFELLTTYFHKNPEPNSNFLQIYSKRDCLGEQTTLVLIGQKVLKFGIGFSWRHVVNMTINSTKICCKLCKMFYFFFQTQISCQKMLKVLELALSEPLSLLGKNPRVNPFTTSLHGKTCEQMP